MEDKSRVRREGEGEGRQKESPRRWKEVSVLFVNELNN
jgi:hypothetical protein